MPRLDHERLRNALEQRAARWKADLRAEPHIARLVLRRLVGPLTLWDESERPDFIRWEATPTTELLDGLAPTLLVASLSIPSWNQISAFLRQMADLQQFVDSAA